MFITSVLALLLINFNVYANDIDTLRIRINTSNKKLEQAFNWAVDMALSHVQTGKSGVIDSWEKGEGSGNVAYIPCYWGGYNSRTAFYSRDICHQVVGGHLLNLSIKHITFTCGQEIKITSKTKSFGIITHELLTSLSPCTTHAYPARSYLPETFFNNNRIEQGWKWMEDIINNIDIEFPVSKTTGDGNYPEISFVLVSNIVEGLMGVEPDAPEQKLASIPRLPAAIPDLTVKNIRIGNAFFTLSHSGSKKSVLNYQSGEINFTWEVRFYGEYPVIRVNGKAKQAQHKEQNGIKISYITEEIKVGETIETTID